MMASSLGKFVPRAPRYVLRPGDNHMFRFAHDGLDERHFTTKFLNLSESGVAFVVPTDSTPKLGEVIKVEFPIPPDNEHVAWFARVVRIEEYEPHKWYMDPSLVDPGKEAVVAVNFLELPEGHRKAIRQGLSQQFQEVRKEQQARRRKALLNFIAVHAFKLFVFALSAFIVFGLLYYLTLPSPNYDAEKGAPWGQRFKNLSF